MNERMPLIATRKLTKSVAQGPARVTHSGHVELDIVERLNG